MKSTEVYVESDLAMKREALTLVGSPTRPVPKGGRLPEDLLGWLESCRGAGDYAQPRPRDSRLGADFVTRST